jgi:2-keto-4-pentenoate hydratase
MSAAWDDPRIKRGMSAQLATRRARIDAGEEPLGWKVGFGSPAALEKLRTAGPLIGFLMQRGQVQSGSTVSLAGWVKPVAEPEIAILIGRDMPAGGDIAQATAAIAALSPAIELADAYLPFEDVTAILTANIFQRHVVLGARDFSRAGGKVSGLRGRIFRRDAEVARTDDPEAATGKLVDIVRHVADTLGACGETLRAGEVIIAGSLVPPLVIEPDEPGVTFELDPIGVVEVKFAW